MAESEANLIDHKKHKERKNKTLTYRVGEGKMTSPASPSKIYSPHGYVSAFALAGLLCLVGGIIALMTELMAGETPLLGISLLVAGAVNCLYASIADAVARTAWQTARLAYDLQPAIDELNLQANEREKRDRAARLAQQAEIQRVLAEREELQNKPE